MQSMGNINKNNELSNSPPASPEQEVKEVVQMPNGTPTRPTSRATLSTPNSFAKHGTPPTSPDTEVKESPAKSSYSLMSNFFPPVNINSTENTFKLVTEREYLYKKLKNTLMATKNFRKQARIAAHKIFIADLENDLKKLGAMSFSSREKKAFKNDTILKLKIVMAKFKKSVETDEAALHEEIKQVGSGFKKAKEKYYADNTLARKIITPALEFMLSNKKIVDAIDENHEDRRQKGIASFPALLFTIAENEKKEQLCILSVSSAEQSQGLVNALKSIEGQYITIKENQENSEKEMKDESGKEKKEGSNQKSQKETKYRIVISDKLSNDFQLLINDFFELLNKEALATVQALRKVNASFLANHLGTDEKITNTDSIQNGHIFSTTENSKNAIPVPQCVEKHADHEAFKECAERYILLSDHLKILMTGSTAITSILSTECIQLKLYEINDETTKLNKSQLPVNTGNRSCYVNAMPPCGVCTRNRLMHSTSLASALESVAADLKRQKESNEAKTTPNPPLMQRADSLYSPGVLKTPEQSSPFDKTRFQKVTPPSTGLCQTTAGQGAINEEVPVARVLGF